MLTLPLLDKRIGASLRVSPQERVRVGVGAVLLGRIRSRRVRRSHRSAAVEIIPRRSARRRAAFIVAAAILLAAVENAPRSVPVFGDEIHGPVSFHLKIPVRSVVEQEPDHSDLSVLGQGDEA